MHFAKAHGYLDGVSISLGKIESRFVRICQYTFLGEEFEYGSPLEFLFISDVSVGTRYVLVSSVPFQVVRSSSAFGIRQMIDQRLLGCYEFQDRSVFCVKHITEYKLEMDGYTIDCFDESSSKFLVIYNEKSAFEQMKYLRSRLFVMCKDDSEPWSSVYSSPDIDQLTSVLIQRFPANLNKNSAGAYIGYNVIVFRTETLTDMIRSFLAKLRRSLLKSDMHNRTVNPIVLCYVRDTENINHEVNKINAPYTWSCNSEQQYTHLLSACILSKNTSILLKVLGTSSF